MMPISQRIPLDNFMEILSDSLHATRLRSFFDCNATFEPVWHVQGFIAGIRLFPLAKLEMVFFRNDLENILIGLAVGQKLVRII